MTPEGAIKRAVKKLLASTRLWYFMPVQNGLGRVGIPDFVGCMPYVVKPEDVGKTVGLFFAIETKAPGKLGTLTANQQRETDGIRAAAGHVQVVDDARHVCLPVSINAQIHTTEAALPEGVQRPPRDGEPPRAEQHGSPPDDPGGESPRRRRQGRSAPQATRPGWRQQQEQPGSSTT